MTARGRLVVVVALACLDLAACATTSAVPAKTEKVRTARKRAPPPPVVVAEPPPVDDDAPTEPPPTEPIPEEPEPPDDVVEEGVASYYADSLAGHRTASGERYKPDLATCAHRTHPFGTKLEVTAVATGATTTCRVNDRGPWVKGRVLDVSKKVARELGMVGPGVLEVRVKKAREPE
jgi:rare lipoprotein A